MTDPKAKPTGSAKDADETTKPANAAPGSGDQSGQITGETGTEQETDQYVLTLSRSTGDVLKIERMDDSGKKEELSEEEYQSIFGDVSAGAGDLSAGDDPYVQAYYQGVSDAHGALQSGMAYQDEGGYSPEESAYYQALSDYDAYLSSGWTEGLEGSGYEDYSPEEIAYYQGIEDYQASLG